MNENLEKLHSIGAKKIHEQTHISLKYVEAILYESFEGMQKVQLMGFISILEREYHVDLSELKEKANDYFQQLRQQQATKEEPDYKKKLLISETTPKFDQKKIMIVAVVIAGIVLAIIALSFTSTPSIPQENNETNTTQLQSTAPAAEDITFQEQMHQEENTQVDTLEINTSTTQEENAQVEENATVQTKEEVTPPPQEIVIPKKIIIIPKKKVWFGYIDLKTKKKKQFVTRRKIVLNGSKEYLLTFGHGFVDIALDDKKQHFSSSKKLKFHYKDGILQEISATQFKALNRGKLW